MISLGGGFYYREACIVLNCVVPRATIGGRASIGGNMVYVLYSVQYYVTNAVCSVHYVLCLLRYNLRERNGNEVRTGTKLSLRSGVGDKLKYVEWG
jgi:hypothetical protein